MKHPLLLSSHLRHSLLILPLAGGAVLGRASDTYALTALILLFEPVIWWVAIHTSLWLFISHQKRLAIAFLLSAGAGLTLLNHPIHPPMAIEANVQINESLQEIKECYDTSEASTVPVRILQWHIDSSENLGLSSVELSRLQPDVLVLQGLSDRTIAEETAELMDGDVLYIPGTHFHPKTAIVVRGRFEACGDAETPWIWTPSSEQTGVMWMRPILAEAGPTPIALTHVASPFESGSVSTWHRQLEATIRTIRTTTTAIHSDKVIVLGSLAAPRNFHQLHQTMMASGLQEADLPASWPSGIHIAPLPGLIALDRLWTGPGWSFSNSRRIRALSQPRALIMTDLNPTTSISMESEASPQAQQKY